MKHTKTELMELSEVLYTFLKAAIKAQTDDSYKPVVNDIIKKQKIERKRKHFFKVVKDVEPALLQDVEGNDWGDVSKVLFKIIPEQMKEIMIISSDLTEK